MFDGKTFGSEIVAQVKGYVALALGPLAVRVADLETRPPIKGDPGKDADPAALEALEIGLGGLKIIVAEMVLAIQEIAAREMPVPQNGKDADPVTPEQISEAVAAYLSVHPPKDGESVKGDQGDEGRGIREALIDADGCLVVTFTDGSIKSVGRVKGADGKNGDFVKGEDGKDGADGLGFDNLEVLHDGERGFTFRWALGDRAEERKFSLPVEIYRGVFKEGTPYVRGDTVTWGGSTWHANEATTDKPGEGASPWTLMAKRGRDGRDGKPIAEKQAQPIRLK